jgi:hypothetical protein
MILLLGKNIKKKIIIMDFAKEIYLVIIIVSLN